MRILISTRVDGSPEAVFSRFDSQLLLSLSPPSIRVKLLRMDDPMRVGGIVHLEVKILGIFKQEWYNEISELSITPESFHFTDRGIKLPGMFTHWQHKHIVRKGIDGSTEIVDDVEYRSRNGLLTFLIYPLVYMQFWYRRPIYRRYFRANANG